MEAHRRPGWELPALAAVTAGAVAALLWAPQEWGLAAAEGTLAVFLVGWGVAALRIFRRRTGLERSAWRWFTATVVVTLAASLALVAVLAAFGILRGDLASFYIFSGNSALAVSALTVAIYGMVFVGLLQLARHASGRRRAVDLVLDAALGAGCLFFVLWSSAYRDVAGDGGLPILSQALVVATPVLDSAILVLAVMAFGLPSPGRPAAYRWMLAGFVALTCADAAGAYVTLRSPDAGALASAVLDTLAVAILVEGAFAVRRAPSWPAAPEGAGPLWVQLLPVWPFGLALATAAWAEVENGALTPMQVWTAVLVLLVLVVRLARALAQNVRLNASLAAAAAAQQRLLRFVSHEMANPLSPLRIELGLARAAPDAARRERAWQVVDRSVARLTDLSKDVRDLALAETGRIVQTTAPAVLAPLVEAACQSIGGVAAARGVAVWQACDNTAAAAVDAGRFGQLLDNLLSNAVKFTPPGGRVDVVLEQHAGEVRLRVTDTGMGLEPQQVAALFEPFSRPNQDAPGMGLGLYLSRSIVEAFGGRLEASSPGRGRGATFEVWLPARATPVSAHPMPAPAAVPMAAALAMPAVPHADERADASSSDAVRPG